MRFSPLLPSLLRSTCAALAASFALLSLGACGGGGEEPVAVDRGPTTLAVDAKLNGLYWDAAQSRLYLTDDGATANALKVWDGKDQFPVAYPLPAMQADQRATLGQVTRAADGNLYTTRFGFGSYGTLAVAPPTGASYHLAGLAGDRRRIALVPTADGTLIDSWFRGGGSGPRSGVISELTLGPSRTASERDLITGLNKPAGLALIGDDLFVADQGSGKILAYSLTGVRATPATAESGRVVAEFTSSDSLDLMTAGADRTLYIGSGKGTLYAVNATTGATRTLASGWPGIQGLALDAANKRLFAAVSAEAADKPSSIRIVPLD